MAKKDEKIVDSDFQDEKSAGDDWLKGKSVSTKSSEPESNLNEKNGVYTPKFGDYKRIFSQEKPKDGNQWFHFRDAKSKYLGSVQAKSKEEALKHVDKFDNTKHLINHENLD